MLVELTRYQDTVVCLCMLLQQALQRWILQVPAETFTNKYERQCEPLRSELLLTNHSFESTPFC